MEVPQPRTPREKKLEGLFDEFVSMGAKRSYGPLARKHGIEGPELMRHARAFLWPERVNSIQIQHNEATSAEGDPSIDEKAAGEVNRLHLTRLVLLQQKAMTYLENVVFDKPETALRMLIESMKLEREIKGLTKDKTDDLRSILMGRIQEAQDALQSSSTPADEPEFAYDPDFEPPPLTDESQRSSTPPSGGDHAE